MALAVGKGAELAFDLELPALAPDLLNIQRHAHDDPVQPVPGAIERGLEGLGDRYRQGLLGLYKTL